MGVFFGSQVGSTGGTKDNPDRNANRLLSVVILAAQFCRSRSLEPPSDDVSEGALALTRPPQNEVPGWVAKFKAKKKRSKGK